MKKILKKYSLAATLMAILCLLPACASPMMPRRHRESNGDDDVYDEGGDG